MAPVPTDTLQYRNQSVHKAQTTSSKRTRGYAKTANSHVERRNGDNQATRRSRRNLRIKLKNLDMPSVMFEPKPPVEAELGKKRIFFCGTKNEVPPNLPRDSGTGSVSVHRFFGSNIVGGDGGDKDIAVKNKNGDVVAIKGRKSLRHNTFNKQSASTLQAILSECKVLGQERSYGKEPVSSTEPPNGRYYTERGPKCSRNSPGIIDLSHQMDKDHRNELYRIILQAESAYCANLDPNYVYAHVQAMNQWNVPGFRGESKKKRKAGETRIFPNIAFGKNVYLPAHTDKDAKLSVAIVCDSVYDAANSDDILAYFCFPDAGFAVALRHGDCLIFDPLEKHCMSSSAVSRDIYTMSCYCKTALTGLNNNGQKLTPQEEEFLSDV